MGSIPLPLLLAYDADANHIWVDDWTKKLMLFVEANPEVVPDQARTEIASMITLGMLVQAKVCVTLHEAGVLVDQETLATMRRILDTQGDAVSNALTALNPRQ